jgi:UDP-3-O-[3-hydroxymyristoyl] glucosamine N-acyltransferase
MKLDDLAHKLGAELEGPGEIEITGVAGMLDAGEGHITFLEGKNFKQLEQLRASAALVPPDVPRGARLPLLRIANPRLAFAKALELFYVQPYRPSGINSQAVIGQNVIIGSDPSLHPFVVVADDVKIGSRVILYPGVYLGKGSVVGDDSVIYPSVCIRENVQVGKRVIIHAGAVLGADGFGFVTDGGKHRKIPQVGGVIIEDDVEIGANTTIDRATLGNTVIKQGTKIDNLVQIAHNVTIGEHCFLMSQVGIAGSCTIGNYVVLTGQVGLADHLTLGDQVKVGAQSGLMRDVDAGQVVVGSPALPYREWMKVQAVIPKLPELKKHLADLEKQIQELKQKLSDT